MSAWIRVEADERAAALTLMEAGIISRSPKSPMPQLLSNTSVELHAGAPQLFAFEQRRGLAAFGATITARQ